MAEDNRSGDKHRGLQHAASVIFALVAIVPLLVFAFTLHSLDVLRYAQAQAALGLALAMSLLGFWVFRSMLARMSENVEALGKVVAQTNRTSGPADASRSVSARGAPAARPAAVAAASPFEPSAVDHHVAGVGAIREFGEMARMMDQLWSREATRYRGRRVQVSVANATAPLVGMITEVTDDGFYIDQDGATLVVTYRRVQGIEGVDPAS